jgi:hypothetical protein
MIWIFVDFFVALTDVSTIAATMYFLSSSFSSLFFSLVLSFSIFLFPFHLHFTAIKRNEIEANESIFSELYAFTERHENVV